MLPLLVLCPEFKHALPINPGHIRPGHLRCLDLLTITTHVISTHETQYNISHFLAFPLQEEFLWEHFHKEINIFYLLVKVTMHLQEVGK